MSSKPLSENQRLQHINTQTHHHIRPFWGLTLLLLGRLTGGRTGHVLKLRLVWLVPIKRAEATRSLKPSRSVHHRLSWKQTPCDVWRYNRHDFISNTARQMLSPIRFLYVVWLRASHQMSLNRLKAQHCPTATKDVPQSLFHRWRRTATERRFTTFTDRPMSDGWLNSARFRGLQWRQPGQRSRTQTLSASGEWRPDLKALY